jgi:hypothetical protein
MQKKDEQHFMTDTLSMGVIKFDIGRDGTGFARFFSKDVADITLAKKILKQHGYKHDGVSAYRGPSWRLARLVADLRSFAFDPYLGASVAAEMGRLAAMTDNAGSVARADARMDAMEAASGNVFRGYQREDVRWMERTGSCINANEMRLGKTVEVLAMVPPEGALVVCPLGVRGVWVDHVRRWLPWCTARTTGPLTPNPGEVVVVNYEALPKLVAGHMDGVYSSKALLVADEAQALKNASSNRTRAFATLAKAVDQSGGRIILSTGTPAKNGRPGELWSLLEILDRGKRLFGNSRTFSEEFRRYYEDDAEIVGPLSRVMTRRTYASVVSELPPYTWEDVSVYWDDLGADGDLKWAQQTLDRLWKKCEKLADPLALMQANMTDIGDYSRCRAILAKLKTGAALEWAMEMQEAGKPALITSAHRYPVLEIGKLDGWGCLVGGMPDKERQQTIDAFKAGDLCGVAFTIGTGGVGLDMSRADDVLFVDRSWVPGDNHQAAARVVSVGNPRPKFGTRLVMDHPLERRVEAVLTTKEEAIGGTIGKVSAAGKKDTLLLPEPDHGIDMDAMMKMMGDLAL